MTLPNEDPTISSLHYADDAIFLGNWEERNIGNLMKVLRWFHLASGLRINWSKSTLVGVKVNELELCRVASAFGCKEGTLPFNYLGFPIGISMTKESSWSPLIERFLSRLSGWKAKLLSYGGKLTLCKSVLGSLGNYLFSLYKAPNVALKKLESIRMNFLWGSNTVHRKIHWVAWDKILNNREKGGLNVGSLKALNITLLTK